MKYKSIFDMSYWKEEQNYPDPEVAKTENLMRLLRTFGTDIVDPPRAKLPAASPEEIDRLMRRVHPGSAKAVPFPKMLFWGLAASLFIAASIVFAVLSFSRSGQGIPDCRAGLAAAFNRRDSEKLVRIARSLETGKSSAVGMDHRTVLSAAAFLAVRQNNRKVLDMIASVSPNILRNVQTGVTRGGSSRPVYLPELVETSLDGAARLAPHQYPLWNTEIVKIYPRMTVQQAEKLTAGINRALYELDSVALAECAVSLASFQPERDPGPCFSADALFETAWNTAWAVGDVRALDKILAIYRSSSLYRKKKYENMKKELQYISHEQQPGQNLLPEFRKFRRWIKEQ